MKLRTLFVLLLLFAAAIEATAQQKAPDLSFKDINGKTVRLSDFRGTVLLVNFWATWCVPCRAEIPDFVKNQRRYRARGLRVLGITYPPEQRSEVRSFMRELKINNPTSLLTTAHPHKSTPRFKWLLRYARRFLGVTAREKFRSKVTQKGARDNGKSRQPITRSPEVVRPIN